MSDDNILPLLNELIDRSRRTETRLTKYLESIGFDTRVQRPYWNGHSVIIPTLNVPLGDIIAQLPQDFPMDEPVQVRCKGQFVMEFYRSENSDA